MKLAIVTDAWRPQVNGVVTTLLRTSEALEALGHRVTVFSPEQHRTIPCPTYPEIRLALWPQRRLAAALDELVPDAIHVATEGPLGMAAASYCSERGLAFTTSMGPVTGYAATGVPHAIASSMTSPKVSVRLGNTSTSTEERQRTSSEPNL